MARPTSGPGLPYRGVGDAAISGFTIASLVPGPHTIRAVYSPDGAFQAGVGTFSMTVRAAKVEQLAIGVRLRDHMSSAPAHLARLPWADFATVQVAFNGGASSLKASDFSLVGARFGNYLAGSDVRL